MSDDGHNECRAKLLEYMEALAKTRRESSERLHRIQVLTAALPGSDEIELIRSFRKRRLARWLDRVDYATAAAAPRRRRGRR